jgi:exonuclease III
MLRFLFWNLNGKDLQQRVAKLVRAHQTDVLVLAECSIPENLILDTLNVETHSPFCRSDSLLENLAVFTRLGSRSVVTLLDDEAMRLTFQQVWLPSGIDLLLVATHFRSKLYWSDASQSQACNRLGQFIRRQEDRIGHSRTVLLGDLNMNPFEVGVVSSDGLHATMARQVVRRESRRVLGEEFPFFYNPMWGHFGDALDGPPGTYYDSRSEPVTYFWNIFDQVLIRPSLLDAFVPASLKILDSDGDETLLTDYGVPRQSTGSDHLPITFALNL